MELFYDIYKLFQAVLISGMFISVLFVIGTGYIFKKINIQLPIDILCWIMVAYASLGLLSVTITLCTDASSLSRATGPYWWSYLIMMVSSTLLPFILLNQKIRSKKFLVFIISIMINCGWLFERLIMGAVSLHRDYLPPGWQDASLLSLLSLFSFFPSDLIPIGICIGLLTLIAGNIKTWKNKTLILNKN
jgi:hypothetical protein